MAIAFSGIFLRALGLCDSHRIACFKKLQGKLCLQHYGVELIACGNVTPALQKLILRVNGFCSSQGIGAHDVLKHDHIAGLSNCVVGLRGNNQREGLQVGGCAQLAAMVTAYQYFSQIHRPALR
jgi:hypothetical protein